MPLKCFFFFQRYKSLHFLHSDFILRITAQIKSYFFFQSKQMLTTYVEKMHIYAYVNFHSTSGWKCAREHVFDDPWFITYRKESQIVLLILYKDIDPKRAFQIQCGIVAHLSLNFFFHFVNSRYCRHFSLTGVFQI